jgi:chromosomal replication initiation ATPase DnaA
MGNSSPPMKHSQLTLDLPHLSATGAEDFLVSATNQAVTDLITRWPDWPAPSVVVCGDAGVGKSHLVQIWVENSSGMSIAAAALSDAALSALLPARAIAIEDLDRGIGDEKALFHLLNRARDGHCSLLFTARREPGDLAVDLPDLRSRLRATPVVRIGPPDDALLQALLVKLFADRQLRVEPAVIRYLTTHMERSAEAAVRTVAEVDRLALATHRKPSAALAGQALRNISGPKI